MWQIIFDQISAVDKPTPLQTSMSVDVEVLGWYEWARSKDYGGTLGDFINEVVKCYFAEHGLIPIVGIRKAQ